MIDSIIQGILSFKEVFFLLCGIIFVLGTVLFFLCRQVDFKKNYRFTGFFFDMTMRESIVLSLAVVKIVSTIYWAVVRHSVGLVELVFIGAIVILYQVMRPGLRYILVDFANYVLLMGALVLIYIMERYRVDVYQDTILVIAMILLQCFVCFFAIHDFVNSILRITDIQYKNNHKVRRSNHETEASEKKQVDLD